MGVQALGPELAVQAFDECVIRRLARAGEVEHDAAVIGEGVGVAGGVGRDRGTEEPGVAIADCGQPESNRELGCRRYGRGIQPST